MYFLPGTEKIKLYCSTWLKSMFYRRTWSKIPNTKWKLHILIDFGSALKEIKTSKISETFHKHRTIKSISNLTASNALESCETIPFIIAKWKNTVHSQNKTRGINKALVVFRTYYIHHLAVLQTVFLFNQLLSQAENRKIMSNNKNFGKLLIYFKKTRKFYIL